MNAKWLLDALSHGGAPNVEMIHFSKLVLDAEVMESWRRGRENNAWRNIRHLRLGLLIPDLEIATPFVQLLEGGREGRAGDGGEGTEEGGETIVSTEASAGGGGAGDSICSVGAAFFPEVRYLHLKVGDSLGRGCCGGAVWSAMVRKACPRLEVAEARLDCRALCDVALSVDPLRKRDFALLPIHTSRSSSLSQIQRAVRSLHFSGEWLANGDLEAFAAAVQRGALPLLEELHISSNSGTVASAATSLCQALSARPRLRSVSLPWMTDESIKALTHALASGAAPQLQSLTFYTQPKEGLPAHHRHPIQDSAFLPFIPALGERGGCMLHTLNCRLIHISDNALGALAWTLSSTGCPLLRTFHLPVLHVGQPSGAVAVGMLQASPKGRQFKIVK